MPETSVSHVIPKEKYSSTSDWSRTARRRSSIEGMYSRKNVCKVFKCTARSPMLSFFTGSELSSTSGGTGRI